MVAMPALTTPMISCRVGKNTDTRAEFSWVFPHVFREAVPEADILGDQQLLAIAGSDQPPQPGDPVRATGTQKSGYTSSCKTPRLDMLVSPAGVVWHVHLRVVRVEALWDRKAEAVS